MYFCDGILITCSELGKYAETVVDTDHDDVTNGNQWDAGISVGHGGSRAKPSSVDPNHDGRISGLDVI